MNKTVKSSKVKTDEKYVLLCALSREDAADAQNEAAEIAKTGTQARVILCDTINRKDLYSLALSGNCIYCALFTHEPVPEDIAVKLCSSVRVYAFSTEDRRSGDDRRDEDRRGQDRRSGVDRRTGDRRTGDRRTGDRRIGDRRTDDRRIGDRRTDDRTPDGAALQDADTRSGEDRRGSDRRGSDRRANDDRRSETERRVVKDRRSGTDRRSDNDRRSDERKTPPRRIYSVFIDNSLPEGYRVRCCEKSASATASSLVGSVPDADAAAADNKKPAKRVNSRLAAIIVALLLIILYCLLYRASFEGCISPIF